ncbi:GNAT family N-acetyltransferase [Halobacillus salinarum]|uniref:GNAT family N-acetyltransferase n=1 Tax=Halobacillus salinarum TaxID=2932257 RepID=A0ABY4EMF5_9BACI|nr:GNAT family N-acetyltransferase [Halobacillus salinarum]UOQ45570.1 GNAT family N-acetyltransferase [Halobacillus salinarum]
MQLEQHYHFQSHTSIDENLTRQIRELELTMLNHDQFETELYLAENLNFDRLLPWVFTIHENSRLIAVLQLFIPTRTEIELMGFTHPDYRSRGLFRSLQTYALNVWKNHKIPSLLYLVNGKSRSGEDFAVRQNGYYEFTEYFMKWVQPEPFSIPVNGRLTMRSAQGEDLDLLTDLNHETFGLALEDAKTFSKASIESEQRYTFLFDVNKEAVGMGSIAIENELISIYGVGILPAHQGKGLGKELMYLLLEKAQTLPAKQISLEVNSENFRAFQLYKQLGFEVTYSTDYFRKTL